MQEKNNIEKLKEQFVALDSEADRNAFMDKMKAEYDQKSLEEKTVFIAAFEQSAREACEKADAVIHYVDIRLKLADILEFVSMSYIARHYFNKTKAWFSQRLNGHLVNGIPATFTPGELKTLSDALSDISRRIKDTARSIA
ncbi:carboxypeptidase C (cathepsin A) [Parabacteroides sp. PFB2-12]|uniref:DUF5053 domain-containing protein n=1 Tax=unclassified Parabacteroides TaxID=2649774 RepID=UPI0024733B79|nr:MULTISPECIES: DUF5053 domain-containing protein [unclassified Parabacteroides]MDH6341465.1 carboxypeptidase C (cathepsin A) [Parabacteroides sp. PM6-13]MDH6389259.1 carboxypeptidase C (cathepsin A) [Parabacteroides sp. PFB2-12]